MISMSVCMDCGGPCTYGGDPDSHGICDHCTAKRYPAWPASQRHAEAMGRGAAAFSRGTSAQLQRLAAPLVDGKLQEIKGNAQ